MIHGCSYMQNLWQKAYDKGIEWGAAVPAYPVYKMLENTAQKYPSNIAMDFLGKCYTWAELDEIAARIAAWMQSKNYGAGTRVGLMLPNTPFYPVFYYGCLKAGATVVNINPLYAPEELEHIVKDSGLTALVTLDLCALFDKAEALYAQGKIADLIVCRFTDVLPFPKNLFFPVLKFKDISAKAHSGAYTLIDDVLAHDLKWQDPKLDPHTHIAVLQYTGGTTGLPKAAALTHANVSANAEQCAQWIAGAKAGVDVMMAVIPFFHAFSMTAVLNLATRQGLKIVATPRFDALQTMRLIQKHKASYFPAVPAIYNAILNHPKRKRFNLTSLLACISGGAPLPIEVKAKFEHTTGAKVVEGYGLSEASPVVCVNPINGVNKAGSIGVPLPATQVKLETLEGEADTTKGELCVKGPQVMQGYWQKPDETQKVLVDGWLHTGDVATMDADGYFFIVDRLKDMIITNGYKIYPRHVEEIVYRLEAVEECIVAGLPDPDRGEITKVWLKLKEGQSLSEAQVKAFLADKLSPLEQPKLYEFRNAPLPKTLIGKLSRKDVVREEMEKRAKAF